MSTMSSVALDEVDAPADLEVNETGEDGGGGEGLRSEVASIHNVGT